MISRRKTILVTGGAKRVGRHIVERLAAAGHHIVIHANSGASEAEALAASLRKGGAKAWAVAVDLADAGATEALIPAAAKLVGAPLSGLVNSASIFDFDTPGAIDAAAFDRAMAINLRAPALLSQYFAAQADVGADNCIVNVLDQKLWNMNPDFFSYTLSKAGLLSATDMMARAFAPKVRVNAVAPGLLLPSHDQTEEEFAATASRNPMGRPIALDDVVSAIDFLMGNTSLTGQVIHADNGQRMFASARDVIFEARTDSKDNK
jgi:NAD(P)-dependent dehydrogenase (short-subunit alcohol dehydrogenase family)